MGVIERRKREIVRRRNFLPTFIIIISLWGMLGIYLYSVDPNTSFAIPLFFLLVFISLFFTLAVVFANTRRGGIAACTVVLFLLLRYFGAGNVLNLALLSGAACAFEIYFSRLS